MNTYNVNDENFVNSDIYKRFISENGGTGHLRIHAYAASGAVPISGLGVSVSTIFDDDKIILFEGMTDASGVIEAISLPAPIYDENNLVSPIKRVYEIDATYAPDNLNKTYKINMFDGVSVVQTIKVTPDMSENMGDI